MKMFRLLIPATLNYSEAIRVFSTEACEEAGFSEREKNMVKLVLDEIFMNAVRYGSNRESYVFIEGGIKEGEVVFAIEDEGKGKEKITAEDLKKILEREKANTELTKMHGRGLAQITRTMASNFDILDGKNGGIRIEFSKKVGDNLPEKILRRSDEDKQKKVPIESLEERIFTLSGEMDIEGFKKISKEIDDFINSVDYGVLLSFDASSLKDIDQEFFGHIASWYSKISSFGGRIVFKKLNKNLYDEIDKIGLSSILEFEN